MAKQRQYIEPKTVVVSNPGVNYGVPTAPLAVWVGYVRSWEQRVRFGKHLPTPWWKSYEVRATSAEMALPLLAKLAQRDGYALGGVQNIHRKEG